MRLINLTLLRAAAAGQDGFSMLAVLLVMFAASGFIAVGYAAAQGDLPVSRASQDRKVAYAAAEAGVNWYKFRLDADTDFWSRCDTADLASIPVNQPWNGTGADPRRWRTIPGSTAQYTIELIPAGTATQCIDNDAASVIDPQTASLRIRVTGRPSPASTVRRTIVASFRRDSFLDFLYFTDYETLDPAAYGSSSSWAAANCEKRRADRHKDCLEIQFFDFDRINGPFHTNDDIITCGNPIFGRGAADKIEVSGPEPGWERSAGCSGTPQFKGPFTAGTKTWEMPPTNAKLATAAQAAYTFTGKTTIRFNSGGGMTVTNPYKNGGAAQNLALPANGVIYVKNGGSGGTAACVDNISPLAQTYSEGNGCAQVYVSGTYTGNVTIGSQKDIIIRAPDNTSNGDLVRSNDKYVLGLVANNYVRVAHPVDASGNNVTTGTHRTMTTVKIDAAILSLQHSFIVDNYQKGAKLGKLTVYGAIAQQFRGPVGTSAPTGYEKDYNYDDRLRYRSPPFFLDPVKASWNLNRINEQVPATK
jgi:hypothetical protein